MNSRNSATYLLAVSLFSLAGAIIYFTWEVAQVREQIPEILASVEQTSNEIEPVVDEIAAIRDLIPPILNEVAETRKLVSPILEEVRLTREQIPSILQETGKIREQIPPILKEVEKTRKQIPSILKEVKAVRKELPAVLKSTDKASDAIVLAAREVEKTREAIPPMLDRADQVIAGARVAGQEASKGAVTGVITGIFTAPFAIVGNIGKSVVGLSDKEARDYGEKDLELLKQAGQEALISGKVGTSKEWENPESGFSGKMTLISIDTSGERECRVIHLQSWKRGKLKNDKQIKLCLNEDQQWEEVK